MKAIKILAVLAMVMFVVDMLGDAATGFMRGTENAQEQVDEDGPSHFRESCTLELKAVGGEATTATLNDQKQPQTHPYIVKTITVDNITPSVWYWISFVAAIPFALAALFGLYCVGRLIVSVLKGAIFTQRNVWRMRIFVYATLIGGFFIELQQWILYQSVASQIALEGYEVAGYSLEHPWFSYLMLALFTEIFAAGVKLKEEQDLTI